MPPHADPGADPAEEPALAYLATQVDPSIVTGAHVAETEWLRALVRHGQFRRLSIHAAGTAAQRAALAAPLGADPRVEVVAARELPARVAERAPDVFQLPYLFASQIAYLRERFAAHPFPITGLVHAIADADTKPLLARNLAFASHDMDVAICPSRHVRTALLSISEEIQVEQGAAVPRALPRTALIPLGIDTERFRAGDSQALRAANGIAPDAILLGYVGRLSPWTKADLLPLLVAFQRLCAAVPAQPLMLLIVGEEQAEGYAALLMSAAQSLGIAERVAIWTGVPRDQVVDIYRMSDIFVSPADNLQETFGLTLIEAMACGVPVVASAWNGYREIVEDGATGFLVPTYAAAADPAVVDAALFHGYRTTAAHAAQTTALDLRVLVDRLASLVVAPDLRRRLGERAAEVARTRYDWKVVIAAHQELWREERRRGASRARATGYQPYRTDTTRHFRHYASGSLDAETRLRRQAGAECLPASVLSSLARMASVDWPLACRLLDRLAREPGASVAALQAGEEAEIATRRAMHFLLKHGLVEIDAPEI